MKRSRALLTALAVAQAAYGMRRGEGGAPLPGSAPAPAGRPGKGDAPAPGSGSAPAADPGAGATRAIVALMVAAGAVEAVEARGARRGALPLLAAGAVGFGAELVGVATGRPFGRYSYSEQLGPRVCGVPLLAAAAWAALARPAWVSAGWLTTRRTLRVPAAAAALTAWDVFLDPRMVAEGYWTWPGGGRYEGVPASNFAGWFTTGLLAFGLVAAVDGSAPDARDDGALALYTWTWGGEGVANALLWRRARVAAAGGAAMGAIAGPALWHRWRATLNRAAWSRRPPFGRRRWWPR